MCSITITKPMIRVALTNAGRNATPSNIDSCYRALNGNSEWWSAHIARLLVTNTELPDGGVIEPLF
ncbi:hypothetical protein G1C94_1384 [Bifidobacterium sp. DSM 109963]|uniref:Uncharacterized protein n=1 Tax=Bifidobacterium panos TaxID=2675321 RepID=A0ABX1T021_9BIFI|nr:hypothetical protein [Bifidobacterium sp. DSM 109963]